MCQERNKLAVSFLVIKHILTGKPFVLFEFKPHKNGDISSRALFREIGLRHLDILDAEMTKLVECITYLKK